MVLLVDVPLCIVRVVLQWQLAFFSTASLPGRSQQMPKLFTLSSMKTEQCSSRPPMAGPPWNPMSTSNAKPRFRLGPLHAWLIWGRVLSTNSKLAWRGFLWSFQGWFKCLFRSVSGFTTWMVGPQVSKLQERSQLLSGGDSDHSIRNFEDRVPGFCVWVYWGKGGVRERHWNSGLNSDKYAYI